MEKSEDKPKQQTSSQKAPVHYAHETTRGRHKQEERIFVVLLTALFIALAILVVLLVGFVRSLSEQAVVEAVSGTGGVSGIAPESVTTSGTGSVSGTQLVSGTSSVSGTSGILGTGSMSGTVSMPVSVSGTSDAPLIAAPYRGTLVFVIDDAGNNLYELEPFLQFPGPLTIAVLPGLPESAEAARRIRAAGKEVFLHQPMEAIGGEDPGPGAVYAGMNAAEIREIVEHNLDEIGPVAGMNNHQGSKITMSEEAMETILTICRERGIFFLDSRTTADTVVPIVAQRINMPIGERDVFLDNIQDKASMIEYAKEGLRKANLQGKAVMIGHTWSPELAATLGELYPGLIADGYVLSTMSNLRVIP